MNNLQPTQMYNLVYIVNGIIRETIEQNKPKPILRAKQRNLMIAQNHRLGLLMIRKV